jgi:hypothetical protein
MIEHCCFRLRGCESWARDLAGIHQTNATALGGIPVLVGMSDGTHSPRQRKKKLLGGWSDMLRSRVSVGLIDATRRVFLAEKCREGLGCCHWFERECGQWRQVR